MAASEHRVSIGTPPHTIRRVRMIKANHPDYVSWKNWVKRQQTQDQSHKMARRAKEIELLERQLGVTFASFVATAKSDFAARLFEMPVSTCGECQHSKPNKMGGGLVCWRNWQQGRPPSIEPTSTLCIRPPRPVNSFTRYLGEGQSDYFAYYLKWRIKTATHDEKMLDVQHVAAWLNDLKLADRSEIAPKIGFQNGTEFEKWAREWLCEIAAEADLAVYPLRIFAFDWYDTGCWRTQYREVDALIPDHTAAPPRVYVVEFKADGCFSGADRFYEWYRPLTLAVFPGTTIVPVEVVKTTEWPVCAGGCDCCQFHSWSSHPGSVVNSVWASDPERYNILWLKVGGHE